MKLERGKGGAVGGQCSDLQMAKMARFTFQSLSRNTLNTAMVAYKEGNPSKDKITNP